MKKLLRGFPALAMIAVLFAFSLFGCDWEPLGGVPQMEPKRGSAPAAYKVTFDRNDGGADAVLSVETVSAPATTVEALPEQPDRNGYVFDGWNTAKNGSGEFFTTDYSVSKNTTVYAQWVARAADMRIVTFDGNGGEAKACPLQKIAVSPAYKIDRLPEQNPAKSGYKFDGWNAAKDGAGAAFTADTPVAATITVYAKWIEYYTVTFDSKGGSAVGKQQVPQNGHATRPPDPTQANMVFDRWYSDADLSSPWDFGSSVVGGNMTLYAGWLLACKVTFSTDGGTPAPAQQSVGTGRTAAAPPAMTKTGYVFIGWYKEAAFTNAWDFNTDTVAADRTLYAKWGHRVTFNEDGGTPAPAQQTVDHGAKAAEPPAMTKAGYVFDAWYTSNSFATKWNFATGTVTANMTLYAKWRHTVTFDAGGGSPAPGQQTVDHGAKATEPGAMTKTGYVFDAWYTSGSFATKWNFASDTIAANMTLYAKWNPTYSLTVGVATGQSAWGSVQIVSGSATGNIAGTSVTVKATANSGYALIKWASDSAGSTQVSTANPYTFAIAANTTLYAVFKEPQPGDCTTQTVSGVSVPFRYVPGGSFQRDSGSTNISVISTGYRLAESAVTQELFQQIMGTNPSNFNSNPDSGETQNRRPVECVSWYDAIAFCNKMSIADGKEPVYGVSGINWQTLTYSQIPTSSDTTWDAATMDTSKNGYRLPTEMEWMWAAIGADKTAQPNTTGRNKAFAGSDGSNDINDYAWYSVNSNSKTHEVAKKQPNELGLYDMSGNVFEWCWDRYGGYPSGTQPDYVGASSGSGRVRRGGSWYDSAENVRPDYRGYISPNYRGGYSGGFRVLLP